jgi:hypothetical protein
MTTKEIMQTFQSIQIKFEEFIQLDISNRDLEEIQAEFVQYLSTTLEGFNTFFLYAITLYSFTDEEILQWLERFQFNFNTSERMKNLLLNSINTKDGKAYRLERMTNLSVVGNRNLLHFLAEFSYPKTLYYLLNTMNLKESEDAAGFLPKDIASLSVFTEFVKESIWTNDRKSKEEIQQILRVYNEQLLKREKEIAQAKITSLLEAKQLATGNKNSPTTQQLVDSCIQAGSCPYEMKYIERFLPRCVYTPLSSKIETIYPGKIFRIRQSIPDWIRDPFLGHISLIYENQKQQQQQLQQRHPSQGDDGDGMTIQPPNSMNYRGFAVEGTSIQMDVFSLAHQLAGICSTSLGYQSTKVLSSTIHSFVISYDNENISQGSSTLKKHTDHSVWTVNLCLEAVNAKNAVTFYIPKEGDQEGEEEEEKISVLLETGDIIFHPGNIVHETTGTIEGESGRRTNLVIWYKEAF